MRAFSQTFLTLSTVANTRGLKSIMENTPTPSQTSLTSRRLSFLVSGVLLFFSCHSYAAGPWYVSPDGSDASDCLSVAAACATINRVLGDVGFVAGDTVHVAVGTYTSTGDEVVLVDKSVVLSGGWNREFTAQTGRSTLDGNVARRGILIVDGLDVESVSGSVT